MSVSSQPANAAAPLTPQSVLRTRAVLPGPGSFRLLHWLARLGAAGIEPMQHGLGLSQGTVYSHVARLRDAGLVVPVAINDGAGGVVAVSKRGAAHVRDDGLPAIQPRLQSFSTGIHARAVSWLAATADTQGAAWLGPAQLRADPFWRLQRFDGRGHLPDLAVRRRGGKHYTAVEIELHAKTPDRLRQILRAYEYKTLNSTLEKVLYVTTRPAVARLVERTHHRHAGMLKLQVETLEDFIYATRNPQPQQP